MKQLQSSHHHLSGVVLNVSSPQRLAAFYRTQLGMRVKHQANGDRGVRLDFDGSGAQLELRQSRSRDPYLSDPSDEYWKIGITLPNIDIAYEQLRAAGVTISEPGQFLDVGYMCHLKDPEGFQIELLQHTFAGQDRTHEGDPDLPLGGGGQIGQITLRTTEILSALEHYEHGMGMKLLSVQTVAGRGFDLYFLGFTEDAPPHPNLSAVANRPWLYQRRYTTLELQHFTESDRAILQSVPDQTGFGGLFFDQT